MNETIMCQHIDHFLAVYVKVDY